MRVLNTQEMLAVTGAHKGKCAKPVAMHKPLPMPLPKVDLSGLMAKLKAKCTKLPTTPTAPATDDTSTDTSTDTTDVTDTSTDTAEV